MKMLQRPKLGETEDDILKQQDEFLKASGKHTRERNILENEANISQPFKILGDIVEKKPSFFKHDIPVMLDPGKGFPKSFTVNETLTPTGKKSLFAMELEKKKKNSEELMEVDDIFVSQASVDVKRFKDADKINQEENENLQKLSAMSEEEILKEQKKLLETLDPKLVNFLKSRKKEKEVSVKSKEENVESVEVEEKEILKNVGKYLDSKWINMAFLEKEKLEWIGDIPDKKCLESDQPYSARFDFKGDLQPFTVDIDVRNSLYHHGDEPNRPGYTIQELYQLSRSQILQQRVLALNTLANIIRKTKLGVYDVCFDGQLLHKLVESDLFFLLRFSIDDNPLVPASVNCLYNLICNESDEFCLDKLLGVTYRDEQPLLYKKIEATTDEENELKDHVLIGCDMIKGVLRTDLLLRLSYVLNNFTPNRQTIVRVINCFIRISRHSNEATLKIFETPNLINFIYNNVKTNSPIYEGVKLFRVLVMQSKEVAIKMIKKFDLKFLVSFVEKEENPNLLKKEFYLLKLEILYFWRGLLFNDLFVDEFIVWSPCLVRLLLFYTQKVDVSTKNDFDFELFSAMTSLITVCNKKKIQPDSNILVIMRICLEKWLSQLLQLGKYNFSVSKALGCAFRYFTSYFRAFGVNALDLEFIKKINSILVSLFQSEIFSKMCEALKMYSHILIFSEVKRDPDNLPSLCSVYDGGEEFLKIVQNSSALPFFLSLTKYLKTANCVSHESRLIIKLFVECANVKKYVEKVCKVRIKTYNWFMKYETNLLTNYLKLLQILNDSNTSFLSFRLLPLLRVDDKNSLKVLNVIFDLFNLDYVAQLKLFSAEMLVEIKEKNGVINFQNNLIPEAWLYKLLPLLRGKDAVELVCNILKFISLILEKKPELLDGVFHTFRYYHLCSVFLTDSNVFDSEIQRMLEGIFNDVIINRKKVNLNLNIENKKSFYDLYTELITQYAGVSYGLPIFAKFVLFPLQNRFNLSFRKLIWFEYLHVLRVITLPFPVENFICLRDFVEPCETDESLLVAYMNSVSNNVIVKTRNSFVYYIAIGNIKNFLDGEIRDEKLVKFLKRKIDDLKNEELKKDILNFSINNLCSY